MCRGCGGKGKRERERNQNLLEEVDGVSLLNVVAGAASVKYPAAGVVYAGTRLVAPQYFDGVFSLNSFF